MKLPRFRTWRMLGEVLVLAPVALLLAGQELWGHFTALWAARRHRGGRAAASGRLVGEEAREQPEDETERAHP